MYGFKNTYLSTAKCIRRTGEISSPFSRKISCLEEKIIHPLMWPITSLLLVFLAFSVPAKSAVLRHQNDGGGAVYGFGEQHTFLRLPDTGHLVPVQIQYVVKVPTFTNRISGLPMKPPPLLGAADDGSNFEMRPELGTVPVVPPGSYEPFALFWYLPINPQIPIDVKTRRPAPLFTWIQPVAYQQEPHLKKPGQDLTKQQDLLF